MTTTMQFVGGPTALIDLGGVRFLTDPTFDPPGDHPIGNRVLVKLIGPALGPDELGRVDAVLLSHDQHPDNLDDLGREFLGRVPLVLGTAGTAERIGGVARELPLWHSVDVGGVRVTGVPARHGPTGSEYLTGEVRGFVLSGPDCRVSTSAATTRRWTSSRRSPTTSARSTSPCCSAAMGAAL
ncbi:MBL fold metallo-hydrolase [Kutzneria sp. 744]|uniref:MBL fold metallo-hydrolase n=1 Tax=Kutzneria sp. (strain 744) TaxID=345341 RepID=UPI0003EEBDB5|nr:MBL fold metallo-hydrolase [Kutzneria sp. 744]EWM17366.1 hypothetical protein KUTG_07670 [Kutzneria sp. 744]